MRRDRPLKVSEESDILPLRCSVSLRAYFQQSVRSPDDSRRSASGPAVRAWNRRLGQVNKTGDVKIPFASLSVIRPFHQPARAANSSVT